MMGTMSDLDTVRACYRAMADRDFESRIGRKGVVGSES